jgi:hypothetical protein
MAILNNGSVGIGTALPSQKLEVASGAILTSGTNAGLIFQDRTSAQFWQWFGTGATANLYNGSTSLFSVTTAGNVGIGTTSPGAALDVNGSLTASGTVTASQSGLGSTPTDVLLLTNSTAAANGAQQYSGAINFGGQGWKTASTAASQPVNCREYLAPVQGSANPSATLNTDCSINGGAYFNVMSLASGGTAATLSVGNTTTGLVQFGGTSSFFAGIGNLAMATNELASLLGDGSNYAVFHAYSYVISASGSPVIDHSANGTFKTVNTSTNCSSSASPAVCAAAAAGSVVVAAAATTVTVNTTAVTANSQIMVLYDSSLGTKLGVTCNATEPALYGVTARVAATSFTITSSAPITNPACFSYLVIN